MEAAALIWNEDWKVIEQRHVAGGRIWTFTLQRGSEKISFSILLTTTFRVQGADIVPLEPEIPKTTPVEKEHRLSALKLARTKPKHQHGRESAKVPSLTGRRRA
jgi:hypothetical protein